jgi:tetratricopeptide (TPR) repeat protein
VIGGEVLLIFQHPPGNNIYVWVPSGPGFSINLIGLYAGWWGRTSPTATKTAPKATTAGPATAAGIGPCSAIATSIKENLKKIKAQRAANYATYNATGRRLWALLRNTEAKESTLRDEFQARKCYVGKRGRSDACRRVVKDIESAKELKNKTRQELQEIARDQQRIIHPLAIRHVQLKKDLAACRKAGKTPVKKTPATAQPGVKAPPSAPTTTPKATTTGPAATPKATTTGPATAPKPVAPEISAACKQAKALLANAKQNIAAGKLGLADDVLKAVDSVSCPKLAPGVDAARQDITEKVNDLNRQGAAALSACRFRESQALIGKLPPASRPPLAARWNAAFDKEKRARSLITQAGALENQGELKAAVAKLRDAVDLKPCAQTIAAINRAIGRIKPKISAAGVTNAETALGACRFKQSRNLIQNLTESERARLAVRWNQAYDTERKARNLVIQAKALLNQGRTNRAIAKLRQARNLDPCESTVTAIDKAITRILQRGQDAERNCRDKFGPDSIANPKAPLAECTCRRGYRFTKVSGRTRCRRVRTGQEIMAQGHKVCRSQFGNASYAIRQNPNGTFRCGCRGNFAMKKVGGKSRCVKRDIMAEGHRACRSKNGRGSYAIRYLGNNRWQCRVPPRRRPQPRTQPGKKGKCPPGTSPVASWCVPSSVFDGIGKRVSPSARGCGFARNCTLKPSDPRWCNAAGWARWNAFLACKRRSR